MRARYGWPIRNFCTEGLLGALEDAVAAGAGTPGAVGAICQGAPALDAAQAHRQAFARSPKPHMSLIKFLAAKAAKAP